MINILLKNDDEYILDAIGLPPAHYNGPEYNIRDLDKYCKEKGMNPEDLSDHELKQFELDKKKSGC